MIELRAVEPEDVEFMFECEADPQAARWSDYSAPMSRQQLLDYALSYDANPFSAGQLRLIAVNKEGQRIGILDLYDISQRDCKAYVGITIHPEFRGKGYSRKCLYALESFSFSRLGIKSLIAKISKANTIVNNLFVACGYRIVAILPKWHKIGPEFHDFNIFVKYSN